MKHQPYMQITLSTRPLGLEEGVRGRNITCQYVMTRRKNSNTKSKMETGASNEGEDKGHTSLSREIEPNLERSKDDQAGKDQGEKRKMGSSQASHSDTTRGGKKRKK